MKSTVCPSCGAPVQFQSAASILAVCEYCHSTLVRHDLNLEDVGKMAQLQTEFNTYGIAVIEATEAGKKTPKPPAKLADLQWLADKHVLAVGADNMAAVHAYAPRWCAFVVRVDRVDQHRGIGR